MLDLVFKLANISHLFANIWIMVGLYEMSKKQEGGWIAYYLRAGVIEEKDFSNLYITSLYWIIVTFSSVGYGDITGKEEYEYLVQLVVEMIGIGFFGYMIGVF